MLIGLQMTDESKFQKIETATTIYRIFEAAKSLSEKVREKTGMK